MTLSNSKLLVLFLSGAIVVYGLLGGLLEKAAAGDDPYGPLSIFTDVVDKIKNFYVEEPNMQEAFNGALQGMMEALDPYSSFVGAEAYSELKAQAEMPASPGMLLSKRYGYAYVVSVFPNSPAAAEGILTGDLIESVEGTSTTQMGLWETEARLKGAEGTKVSMRIIRARRSEPSTVVLERVLAMPGDVSARFVEEGIGLVRIPAFDSGTADEVATGLRMLQASDLRGLLIDLRGSAFGTPEEAAKAADLFLASGQKIAAVEKRDGSKEEYTSTNEPIVSVDTLVLLVDGGTSGAAELFAAAIRDNLSATLVGERTNGNGSRQSSFPLDNGAVLVLTTEIFLRPNGDPIQGTSIRQSGVEPDVRSPSQQFVSNYYFENTSDDLEDSLVDEFYRGLDEAISRQQLEDALNQVRDKVELKKAA